MLRSLGAAAHPPRCLPDCHMVASRAPAAALGLGPQSASRRHAPRSSTTPQGPPRGSGLRSNAAAAATYARHRFGWPAAALLGWQQWAARLGRPKLPLPHAHEPLRKPVSARAAEGAAEGGAAARRENGPWLLVGLGNPGSKYAGTRHNVGFDMVDALAREEGISITTMQSRALVGKGRIGGQPVLLVKPQTFMNLSGESVGPLAAYYKIPPERVLVMYDELDLDFGVLKLLPKGGPGGHNGMKSIISHLKGNKGFPRLRIGIGRPPGNMDPAVYVLQRFGKHEAEEMAVCLARGVAGVRLVVEEGLEKAVSVWNVSRAPRPSILGSTKK